MIKTLKYQVVHQNVVSGEGEPLHTYGIQGFLQVGGKVCDEAEILDITTNPQIAHYMAEVFERHQLSLCHLHDVVEDMIG
ncbi:MAG: DUF6514 family protein [Defluviitaleaceae bacterium]|nr:DUF6514 family protein [Defluviitaleaceae bacterium]